MFYSWLKNGLIIGALATACLVLTLWSGIAAAAEPGQSETSSGLTVYFGMVPAEIVKGPAPGEEPMHRGIPRGPHEYHVVAAIFDVATGARITDASVTAQVSGLGLSGPSKKLEAMKIAGVTSYGAFFNLPGPDLYTVKFTIERPGIEQPVIVDFKYDHRIYR